MTQGPIEVDARGKPCPEPVLAAREAIQNSGGRPVLVLVSSLASAENVTRMARSLGWQARLADGPGEGEYGLHLEPQDGASSREHEGATDEARAESDSCGTPTRLVVFLPSDRIGDGPEELGRLLAVGFLKTLREVSPRPASLVFMNSGVRLCCEGSEVLEALADLERSGVEILACGTCLDYFGLKEKLAVGRISNMFEIASTLACADRLVRM